MSFSETRLPEKVLVDFYRSVLIEGTRIKQEPANAEITHETVPAKTPKYLGENRQNILVLVNYPKHQHLPSEQLDFLAAILKACHLSIADIAIVNTAKFPENSSQYIVSLRIKTVLAFGEQPFKILEGEPMTDFKVLALNGVSYMSSPPLESLNQQNPGSRLLKKNLWECLRQLFQL